MIEAMGGEGGGVLDPPGHDSLSVWTDVQNDLHDLRFKAHVQHAVSLIQHLGEATIRLNCRLSVWTHIPRRDS